MAYKNTILITGGTQGLGYETGLFIARTQPQSLVLLASRTDPNSSATTINAKLRQSNVKYLPLDLSSLAKTRAFVSTYKARRYPPLAALLMNAGVQSPKEVRYTEDGYESTFGVNHVGHALLFHLLVDELEVGARIVVTASGTHDPAQKSGLSDAVYDSAEELAHPSRKSLEINNGRQRYATSKLCNVIWTYALARRLSSDSNPQLKNKNITVSAFDPGLMPGTNLARDATAVEKVLWYHVMPRIIWMLRKFLHHNVHLPAESGKNLAAAAGFGEKGEGSTTQNGVYWEGPITIKSSVDSYVEAKQEDLWEWTVKNVALNEEERTKFDLRK